LVGPNGKETLGDLFEGRSQLILYHFMFDPAWDEGCKSCSFMADNYNPLIIHLKHRDVTMVTVSRAPLEKLEAFKKRMGWDFKWVSSLGSDFNSDYHVSFTPEQYEKGEMNYNHQVGKAFPVIEAPGISAFYKDESGQVFHTYSAFARGLENLIRAYNLLDIVSKGRDEGGFKYGKEWLRHHDGTRMRRFVDPYVTLVADKRS
jgi:predicted dithiol-disulfide oxidoreductase (DUF899 family)